MSEQTIYHLLSSAARRQYSEDILRVLALPRGAHLQFRYMEDLLALSVREDIRKKKRFLIQKKALQLKIFNHGLKGIRD